MNNLGFAAVIGSAVAVSLGAVSFHYNFQVSPVVKPLVVLYRDNTVLEGRDRQSNARFWTMAIRSDGSFMRANSIQDATGRIQDVKSIEFKDRYVVVDPYTSSTVTYKPSVPIIVGTRDCLGKGAGSMLGHPLEYVREDPRNSKGNVRKMTRERWLAVDLNCVVMREHISEIDSDNKTIEFYREAISVKLGEPSADLFDVPSNYQERGPADLNKEFEARFPGQKIMPQQAAEDRLQKIYEAGKIK
jgi:hypothetical protein